MREYLQTCTETGVTAIPALGFQMIGDEPTHAHQRLCDTYVLGAAWSQMMKMSIFDPDEILEINFVEGRHRAAPVGNIVLPSRDEVLLLHYKYLGLNRTFRRQQQLGAGLGPGDIERKWGFEYFWSEAELGREWKSVAADAVDVHQMTTENYPIQPWWSLWPRGPKLDGKGERQPALRRPGELGGSVSFDPFSRAAFEAAVAAHRTAVAAEVAVIDAAIGSEARRSA